MNNWLYKTSLLFFFCLISLSFGIEPRLQEEVIVVKIPPDPTNNSGTEEEKYWRVQKLLFPQIKIPNPIPPGLPNDNSLLLVTVEKTGQIKINFAVVVNLSKPEVLRHKLKEIFDSREENAVFEPNSNKVISATAIKANLNLKYQDVLNVIMAVEASGANPIVLQLDELPK